MQAIYDVSPGGIQPYNMKNTDIYWRKYKKHCAWDNDSSVPFKVGTLGPHTVLPIAISCPIVFSWISSTVWNLFPLKEILVWGKPRSFKAPNLGCRGAESPNWFDVSPKNSRRRDAWAGTLSSWRCQSPVAHSFVLLNLPNSFRGGMFKLNETFDADSLFYLLSHFKCNSHTVHMLLNGIYCPPLLTSTVLGTALTGFRSCNPHG